MTDFILIGGQSVLDIIQSIELDFLLKIEETDYRLHESLLSHDEIVACTFGRACDILPISKSKEIMKKLSVSKSALVAESIIPNMSELSRAKIFNPNDLTFDQKT